MEYKVGWLDADGNILGESFLGGDNDDLISVTEQIAKLLHDKPTEGEWMNESFVSDFNFSDVATYYIEMYDD